MQNLPRVQQTFHHLQNMKGTLIAPPGGTLGISSVDNQINRSVLPGPSSVWSVGHVCDVCDIHLYVPDLNCPALYVPALCGPGAVCLVPWHFLLCVYHKYAINPNHFTVIRKPGSCFSLTHAHTHTPSTEYRWYFHVTRNTTWSERFSY